MMLEGEVVLKIYLIQIQKHQWEFYWEDSRTELQQPEAQGPSLRSRFMQRLEAFYERTQRAINEAQSGILYLINRILNYLRYHIDPAEPLMKRLRTAEQIQMIYPSDVGEETTEREFSKFLHRKIRQHRRGIILNALLLPLTWILSLIPGPNVFLAWNAYRLISHILAYRGGKRAAAQQLSIEFIPNDELNLLIDARRGGGSKLSYSIVKKASERLHLNGLIDFLRRTRHLSIEEGL